MHKDHCQLLDQSPVGKLIYRRAFNTKFNSHFHSPSKQTYNKCGVFKLMISAPERSEEEKSNLKLEHKVYLCKAKAARNSLRTDTTKAKDDQ